MAAMNYSNNVLAHVHDPYSFSGFRAVSQPLPPASNSCHVVATASSSPSIRPHIMKTRGDPATYFPNQSTQCWQTPFLSQAEELIKEEATCIPAFSSSAFQPQIATSGRPPFSSPEIARLTKFLQQQHPPHASHYCAPFLCVPNTDVAADGLAKEFSAHPHHHGIQHPPAPRSKIESSCTTNSASPISSSIGTRDSSPSNPDLPIAQPVSPICSTASFGFPDVAQPAGFPHPQFFPFRSPPNPQSSAAVLGPTPTVAASQFAPITPAHFSEWTNSLLHLPVQVTVGHNNSNNRGCGVQHSSGHHRAARLERFAIGASCAHVTHWRRLRRKKGITHMLCEECGSKWRCDRKVPCDFEAADGEGKPVAMNTKHPSCSDTHSDSQGSDDAE